MVGRGYFAVLALYVASLTALLWGIVSLQEPVQRLFGESRAVLVCVAGLPLIATIACHAIPTLLRRRRKRRLEKMGLRAILDHSVGTGRFFRLTPYRDTPEDIALYDRADNAHVEVHDWLNRSQEAFLYLTGVSGCGKSSVVNAYLLPQFEREGSAFCCFRFPRAHAFDRLKFQLLEPNRIWKQPPGDDVDVHGLLERACMQVRPRRLLLVIDQFEEYLLQRGHSDTESAFDGFMTQLRDKPIDGLAVLFVVRTDFKGMLDEFRRDYGLPPMRDGETWKELSPFSERVAREFLGRSPLKLGDALMANIFQQLADVEEISGLIRPITLNMVGLVLDRWAVAGETRLPQSSTAGILVDYVRASLSMAGVRDVAWDVASELVTPVGDKRLRSAKEIAEATALNTPTVTGCLLSLAERGLTRLVDEREDLWEPAHDFVARLTARVLAERRRPLSKMVYRWGVGLAMGVWLAAFVAAPWVAAVQAEKPWYEKLSRDDIAQHQTEKLYLHRAVKELEAPLPAVRCLVEKGCKLDLVDQHGSTALARCASLDRVDCLDYLLGQGADPEIEDKLGNTALSYGSQAGNTECVKRLVEAGARVDHTNNLGYTPLMIAAGYGCPRAIELLVEAGAHIDAQDRDGNSALDWAAFHGYDSAVDALLKAGADVNGRDRAGHTALTEAAINGHLPVIESLLRHEADINARDGQGNTSLDWAASRGHVSVVRALISHGAEVDCRDNLARTPLFEAATGGHVEVVRCLLAEGADVTARDSMDSTAIHYAAGSGHAECVRVLAEHMDDLDIVDKGGYTPLTAAISTSQGQSVEILIKCGAAVNLRMPAGDTPLHRAALAGDPEVIRLLLRAGADTSARDKFGFGSTPAQLARGLNRPDIELLFEKPQNEVKNGGSPHEASQVKGP